ncbi:MAG: hypothetical protein KKH01_00675 [Firmicutes bacterium]|nr:hypothetical protein [Bacillota bacterium]
MVFHLINLMYLGVLWFVSLVYWIGVMTDDYCPYYEGARKINIGKFSKLFKFNRNSGSQIWVVSFCIQLLAILLVVLSIVFTMLSFFQDYEYALFLVSLHFVISFISIMLCGTIMAIYRGK